MKLLNPVWKRIG